MASKNFINKRVTEQFLKNIVYHPVPNDVTAYQRMLIHRCNNMGMKELDYILGQWATENLPKLNIAELQQFESEVLDHETPDLFNLTLRVKIDDKNLKEYENKKYVQEIRKYALKDMI